MNFTNKWSDYRDILLACWWTPGYWQDTSSLPGLQFYKDARTASHFCCLKPFLFLGLNPAIPGFDSAAVNLSHNVTAFYPSFPTFDQQKQQTYLSRNAQSCRMVQDRRTLKHSGRCGGITQLQAQQNPPTTPARHRCSLPARRPTGPARSPPVPQTAAIYHPAAFPSHKHVFSLAPEHF